MPPPVRAVEIPKKKGGSRVLGVPTVADRVAQTVAYLLLGARGGTSLSLGLLRVSAGPFGARRGGGLPGTLLEAALGRRS